MTSIDALIDSFLMDDDVASSLTLTQSARIRPALVRCLEAVSSSVGTNKTIVASPDIDEEDHAGLGGLVSDTPTGFREDRLDLIHSAIRGPSLAGACVVNIDGACSGNPGPGGWAAVWEDGNSIVGGADMSTNNRMEIIAAIAVLTATDPRFDLEIRTDSQLVVNTMTKNWKTNANIDLWRRLRELTNSRRVAWRWVKGHSGDPMNERANVLAQAEAQRRRYL